MRVRRRDTTCQPFHCAMPRAKEQQAAAQVEDEDEEDSSSSGSSSEEEEEEVEMDEATVARLMEVEAALEANPNDYAKHAEVRACGA